jgi:flagellar hook protein FlgE
MIRSLYSAVSGLRGHQTMLDVTGNNIANVNTASFKSSRVIFSDLYYQTLQGASAATGIIGGQDPTQIGYGSLVGSIDVVNTRSSYQQTNRSLDVYISGEGYFAVKKGEETLYTRLGAFTFDANGNLLDSSGYFVLDINGDPIIVPEYNTYTSISIQANGQITGVNSIGEITPLGSPIGIAVFPNPEGLQQQGTSHYSPTVNSGTVDVDDLVPPGSVDPVAAGSLITGGLETSNVDLSKEFTDMIVAQRGFQANARVITTSDQVLEELVNIKR